ncbi:MAG: hypothetical protein LBF85_05485 [Tannerella sp.]|jgi:hypothetical protein|nr:hypothetical protein [Tannerella sp.]
MTSRRSTLNKPDEEFLAQANTINSQCHLNVQDWNIDSGRLADFDRRMGQPATRTRTVERRNHGNHRMNKRNFFY